VGPEEIFDLGVLHELLHVCVEYKRDLRRQDHQVGPEEIFDLGSVCVEYKRDLRRQDHQVGPEETTSFLCLASNRRDSCAVMRSGSWGPW